MVGEIKILNRKIVLLVLQEKDWEDVSHSIMWLLFVGSMDAYTTTIYQSQNNSSSQEDFLGNYYGKQYGD